MEKTVFDFLNYRDFLAQVLDTRGESRGSRTRLSQTLGCQTAFISQVLAGKTHFSLEHAMKIAEFLSLDGEDAHFFMLLVHKDRAGSKTLEAYYNNQIRLILERRQVVRNRIHVKGKLSSEAQSTYYSSWYFAAIHILLSIPQYQTKNAIAHYLRLPSDLVSDCLEFLVAEGLAVQEGNRFKIGETRIHLGNESVVLARHHTNWRMRAVQSLDSPTKDDLHYSAVISLSKEDALKIRSILLKALETTEPILRDSPEKMLYCMGLDLFKVL